MLIWEPDRFVQQNGFFLQIEYGRMIQQVQQSLYFSDISQGRLMQQIQQEVRELNQSRIIQQVARNVQEARSGVPETNPQPKSSMIAANTGKWTCPSTLGYIFGAIHYIGCKNVRNSSTSERRTPTQWRIFTPTWYFSKVYEIHKIQDQWSCRYTFRTYNLVQSSNSKLFSCVSDGDVEGVQRLFNSGQATPFDRDEHGWTALHVSLSHECGF